MKMEHVELNENLAVSNTGIFNSSHINVEDSISISNQGVINSDFYIGNELRVYVQNSGTINGQIHVASDSNLIQVVQSVDDITYIDVDKNFSVLVHDSDNVSLSDVFFIGAGADKIILDNSTLVLNGVTRRRFNSEPVTVEIVGDVTFKLDSADGLDYSMPTLHNVSGTGRVSFDVADINPMYKIIADINDNNLYMKLVRETDYTRIFEGDVGKFLNDLRQDSPDDKLLNAMDNAPDIDAINSIMADSVHLNPIKLMAPVRQMDMLDMLGGWQYSDMDNIQTAADVIFSDTSLMYRANVAVAGSVARNIYAAVAGYVGFFDVADDINDFSGHVYGARLNTHFDDGVIVGNLSGGVSRADFDAEYIFDGNGVVNNPGGVSGYAAMDVGAYLLRDYGLTIVPFAGVITHYASVLNESDTTAVANCGIDINLSEHEFDILYDYGIRGNILTDGTQYLGAFIKFSAPDDDIGAELNTAIIHDEYGTGYKISVSMQILF